jgi:hypothetical protein
MVLNQEYSVEAFRIVNINTKTVVDQKVVADIKTKEGDVKLYTIFLPGRYNKPDFIARLPIVYRFEELSVYYEGDMSFSGSFTSVTAKLNFVEKNNALATGDIKRRITDTPDNDNNKKRVKGAKKPAAVAPEMGMDDEFMEALAQLEY